MRVKCEIAEITLENDDGIEVDSVCATCSKCDHVEESFGTSEKSVKRCLVLMRENCELEEDNFYVVSE